MAESVKHGGFLHARILPAEVARTAARSPKPSELHHDTNQPRRHVHIQNISTDATVHALESRLLSRVKLNLKAETSARKRVFRPWASHAPLSTAGSNHHI